MRNSGQSIKTSPDCSFNPPFLSQNRIFDTHSADDKILSIPGIVFFQPADLIFLLPRAALADFSVSPVNGTALLTVQCTDESIGNPIWFVYDFGDGVNVTGPNPVHTFRFPSVYTITLTILKYNATLNSIMSSEATKTNAITVNSVPFIPLFTKFASSPVTETASLTITFHQSINRKSQLPELRFRRWDQCNR